jgi:hypothetical protein
LCFFLLSIVVKLILCGAICWLLERILVES